MAAVTTSVIELEEADGKYWEYASTVPWIQNSTKQMASRKRFMDWDSALYGW